MYDLRSRIGKFFAIAKEHGLCAALKKTAAYVKRNCGFTRGEEAAVNKTIKKWDRSDEVYCVDGFTIFWECLDEVVRYQQQMMTGGKDIVEYVVSFFPQGKTLSALSGLVIGCSFGEHAPPVSMARTGAFKRILVVDIAGELLKRQEQITDSLGLNHVIQYRRMDLNIDSITENNAFDMISSVGTIHHIERLEGLFFEINNALREDGLFCMREYIGPSYLQFTDKQIRLCNEMLEALPDYLKRRQNGEIKTEGWRPTIEEIEADDPSEAVRSDEIMGIVSAHLDVLDCRMTGGTILDPLLHGIAGNFEQGETERAILRDLIATERRLIEEGVIPSDYVFLIARKKNPTAVDDHRGGAARTDFISRVGSMRHDLPTRT